MAPYADLDIDWETDYREKNIMLASMVSLFRQTTAWAWSYNTLPYQGILAYSTGMDVEANEPVVVTRSEAYFYGEHGYGFLRLYDAPTVPPLTEPDTVEIVVDLEQDEIDLSLLDEESREFIQNFVGVFDPGPDFTEDDLTLDDIS